MNKAETNVGYDLQVLQSNVDMLTEQGKYNEAIELLKKRQIRSVMKTLCKVPYSMS